MWEEKNLMFIYQKYQMGDESQREIKEMGNMFISLLEKCACWRVEAPAGH